MKFALIGHGKIAIPPTGYGAVESILTDYRHCLQEMGHEVLIVNVPDHITAAIRVRDFNPDVLHVHDDNHLPLFDDCPASINVFTTHNPTFFESKNPFLPRILKGNFLVHCLCDRYHRLFRDAGVHQNRLYTLPNGARSDLFDWKAQCDRPPRIAFLASFQPRKRQHLTRHIPRIDYIGPPTNEWSRERIYRDLTNYAALILPSSAEVSPLAVVEGLMAGLTVIVSEVAGANLDGSLPFVKILPEKELKNPFVLNIRVEQALRSAPKYRAAACNYAEDNFDCREIVNQYLNKIT